MPAAGRVSLSLVFKNWRRRNPTQNYVRKANNGKHSRCMSAKEGRDERAVADYPINHRQRRKRAIKHRSFVTFHAGTFPDCRSASVRPPVY